MNPMKPIRERVHCVVHPNQKIFLESSFGDRFQPKQVLGKARAYGGNGIQEVARETDKNPIYCC